MFKLRNHSPASQYTAISAIPQEIKEKVFLEGYDFSGPIEISEIHTPLCLQPLLIGINIRKFEGYEREKKIEISVVGEKSFKGNHKKSEKRPYAKINLRYFDFIEYQKNIGILLLKVKKSRLFQLDRIERYKRTLFLYLHYLKIGKRNSFSFLNNLTALYSYPRKVVLNIIKTDSHFNIFPMDLVCELDEEDIMVLGLNIKNRSIEDIIRTKKMLIVYPDASSKNIVYGFAGNNNKELIESDFPVKDTIKSETFNFPVPDFATAYKEISCFKHIKLGSHYLLMCQVINNKILKVDIPLLFHVSSIHQLHLEQQNNSYSAV